MACVLGLAQGFSSGFLDINKERVISEDEEKKATSSQPKSLICDICNIYLYCIFIYYTILYILCYMLFDSYL